MRPSAALAITLILSGCALDSSFKVWRPDSGTEPIDANVQPGDAGPDDAGRRDAGPPPDGGGQCEPLDLCNRLDDDCNGGTADGSGEDWFGEGCDGADVDLCVEGQFTCTDGVQTCSDTTGETPDVCDGMNNDCDPSTPDGAADTGPGMGCDGDDSDMCFEGDWQCNTGMRTCGDSTDNSIETCNGRDDDCNGMIDDNAGCPCELRINDSHAYLFCRGGSTETWDAALGRCEALPNYSLVKIESAEENRYVDMQAGALMFNNDWWIGANDRTTEDTFVWTDGSAVSYRNFESPPTNGGPGGNQDCVELDPATTGGGPSGTDGGWNDQECDTPQPYVCEASVP